MHLDAPRWPRWRGAGTALGGALCAGLLTAPGPSARAQPLDPYDATPRAIQVEQEISSDPGVVGQSYGPPLPASYSASDNVGTVVIPIESHEQMRSGLQPLPGTFTPIVIKIDLTDLSAASQSASGAGQNTTFMASFTQGPLSNSALAGYVTGDLSPLFCTSQQEVDDACTIQPLFCGQTCAIVPGSPYDPATGKVNLVGSETQEGCEGAVCFGPFTFFSEQGDLRFSEDPQAIPALSGAGLWILGALLLASAWVLLERHAGARTPTAKLWDSRSQPSCRKEQRQW